MQEIEDSSPWSREFLEKLIVIQQVKFPAFYGTRRFITVFKRSCPWFLSWARCIQSTPFHPISLRSVLILSSNYLCLPSGLFSSDLWIRILHAFNISPMCATYPDHLILIDMITVIISGGLYKLWGLPLRCHLQPPATFSVLGQNIFLSTLFSNSLNLCSSLSARDQVSHPYKTTCKLMVLYILISLVLEGRENRILAPSEYRTHDLSVARPYVAWRMESANFACS
jgi:hypothetical protein